ncbi:MAG: hypothetical protein ACRD2C_10030 [Acidimicrobiales bacterium]
MNTQPKPSEIIIMVSGLVALISAFLAWYSFDTGFGSADSNAFDDGLFPLATYIPLIGLIMGVQVALARFANVSFPDRVIGFTWTQIHLVLSIFAGLLAIGYLLLESGGADKGIGFWLGFLASAGLIVGSVMLHLEGERATAAPSAPPQPF